MPRTHRITLILLSGLLLAPLVLAAEGPEAAGNESAGDDAALLQEEAAGYEVALCVLWQDVEAGEVFTDEQVIEACIANPGKDQCEWELQEGVHVKGGVIVYRPGPERGPLLGLDAHDRMFGQLRWDF